MAKELNQDFTISGDLYFQGADKSVAPTKVITKEGVVAAGDISLADLTATGDTTLGDASTDTTSIVGATSITTNSASGLAVGLAGATNPALQVDASTASSATGLKVKSAAAAGGLAISTVSSGTNESLTIDAKGNGTVTINGTATGIVALPASSTIGGSAVVALATITSTSANALTTGPAGATNPSFNVDASTGSAATGLNVKSAAAAGGLAVSTLSSGSDESLTLDAKGTGTITLNGTATGNIITGAPVQVTAAKGIVSSVSTLTAPFIPIAVGQALSGAGEVNLTSYYTAVTNTGSDALTLADSTVVGQLKKVQMIVDPGTDSTLTFNTDATVVFADVGDTVELMWNGSDWLPIALYNIVDGATAPAYTPAS